MNAGQQSVGHPVNVATGTVYSKHRDCHIPGSVDLVWDRRYSTSLLGLPPSSFGPGWSIPYHATLTVRDKDFYFVTPEGETELFADPDARVEQGGKIRNLGSFQELFRAGGRYVVLRWDVDTGEIQRYVFPDGPPNQPLLLESIENESAQGLDMIREKTGRLAGVRQRLENRTLSIDYNSDQSVRQVAVQLPGGRSHVMARYEYDSNGGLIAALDARNFADRFEYDDAGRVIREVARDGGVFSFKYDEQGRCVHTSGLNGYDEKTLRYRDNIGWTEVTDSLGHTSRFEWRSDGQVLAEHDPTGRVRRYEYDEEGRIVVEIAANEGRVSFTYDAQGNRCRTEDPLGVASEVTFNDSHLPLTFLDPRGGVWRRSYDSRNRLVASEDSLGNRFAFRHDAKGRVIQAIDPLENVLTQTFSEDGLTQEISDGRGKLFRHVFDGLGQLVARVDATGATIQYKYDAGGNPVEIVYPDGTSSSGQWDAGQNLIYYRDRGGRTSRYRFGSCGRLLEKTEPNGGTVTYEWSTEPRRLLSVTNAAGETYRYHYDAAGRIVREVGFDGRAIELEYDANGEVLAVTGGNGERTEYERDPLGRMTAQVFASGSKSSFTYDKMGALLTAVNNQTEVSIERDLLGRVIVEQQGPFSVRRTYDPLGRVTSVESGSSPILRYQYDNVGNPVSIAVGNDIRWDSVRNLRGDEETRRLPGRMALTQSYGPTGQVLTQEVSGRFGSFVSRRAYTYEGPLPVRMEDSHQGMVNYEYDAGERLIGVTRTHGPNEQYGYDENGNLISTLHGGEEERFLYQAGSRLYSRGRFQYEYDEDGRRVRSYDVASGEELRYRWNEVDQLREVEDAKGRKWNYSYDAFSRLIEKTGPSGARQYVWDDDIILEEVSEDKITSTWVFEPLTFAPVGVVRSGRAYSLVADRIGTPYVMVNDEGREVWAVRHRAWGQADALVGDPGDCPIRFPGQWWMPETKLHYNRYRYYDPAIGAFVSQDPAGLSRARSLYFYGINPVRWIDPYGLVDKFVGDSNLFMDKPGAPGTRDIADKILADPSNTIVVPKAIKNEVNPTPTQLDRLNNSAATVQPVRSANVAQTLRDHPDILSKKFGENDLKLVATAKAQNLPVVTTNAKLKGQIENNATRKALFGSVKILVVGEDVDEAGKPLKKC